uniref:Virion infectivity factor n=1 Tax=Simian immunodeficiency virus TaxID=11723 RepID=Q70IH4_SIV|nr:vif protein [Simian immunodeficiency virus]
MQNLGRENRTKEWIVRLTYKIGETKLEHWMSTLKSIIYKTNELKGTVIIPHFRITWEWYTMTKIHIPLRAAYMEVKLYWHLTPEKGYLSQVAISIAYVHLSTGWATEVDPVTADEIIHKDHFSCFTRQAVRQALRGEVVLSTCARKKAHYHPRTGPGREPPSLQYIVLQAAIRYGKVTTITPTSISFKNGRNHSKAATGSSMGYHRGGKKTLQQRRDHWNMGSLLVITSAPTLDRRTSHGSRRHRFHKNHAERNMEAL